MKDMKQDFESFATHTAHASGSPLLLQKIRAQIEKERPAAWIVATKLGAAHALGSLVTLMSCSQFGVQLFFHDGGLMNYFMQISPTFCHTFCGALYFSVSFLVARAFLRHDEWLMILHSRVLSIATLALISLGGFSIVSHEISLEGGLLWFLGAALGGEFVTLIKSPRLWFSRA